LLNNVFFFVVIIFLLDQSSSGNSNGKYRLCWHTGPELGGYRCGNHVNLNDDENYVRYIYHVD